MTFLVFKYKVFEKMSEEGFEYDAIIQDGPRKVSALITTAWKICS